MAPGRSCRLCEKKRKKESRMARVFGEEAKYRKKEIFCAALASFSEILLDFLPLKLEMTSLLC